MVKKRDLLVNKTNYRPSLHLPQCFIPEITRRISITPKFALGPNYNPLSEFTFFLLLVY
jgi:hypothetical protein